MRFTPVVYLMLSAAPLAAQQTYVPSNELPNGEEVFAVYITANSCGACHFPQVKEGVKKMKLFVSGQARRAGASFQVMGVANDWEQDLAAKALAEVGPFDQVSLGGNWTNLAIERFIWRDSTGNPAMPQVLVFERTVKREGGGITFSEPRLLHRALGAKEIPEWVDKGALI